MAADRIRLLALIALVAGVGLAIAQLVVPIDHGVWLVAYLLLVGFLAPTLLQRAEAGSFDQGADPGPGADARPLLWAVGTVAVPAGVLADMRILVVVGSAALLWALASMAVSAVGRPSEGSRLLRWAYPALIAFMVVSVAVGTALAWDVSWF
jgi:hypothetical protein